MKKYSFKRKTFTFDDILGVVYTDLCGPIGVQRYYGDKYFILFVDDYSIMMNMMFFKEKLDAFQLFKWYLKYLRKNR